MAHLSFLFLTLLGHIASTVYAAPITSRAGTTATTPVSISAADVSSKFGRAAEFSRVSYCSSAAVTSWKCGPPCDSLGKGIEVIQAGGDDGLVPMYFVAHDPVTQSIVVAHQGTEPSNILSILNDAQFLLTGLNSTRFPAAKDGSIKVHSGFQKTFERTADGVLAGVQKALKATNVKKVVVTGHSLGAAIATMDAVMLKQALGSSVSVTTTVFGLPRGGNQAWADFVDAALGSTLTRISNQNDPVPTVPPRFIGFQHPQGEVHIKAVDAKGAATDVVVCAGQENENCSEGNSVLKTSIPNHLGPYFDNISFGGASCPL
ncbi:hypothetical protein HGRIS_004472 [Hohenbuehelia grisea]|uniref:Fungal lipase-type domain-containing protein n=1 Tax=Hohenbuehelia grisea TaxID=104357 RepID=A0ABR3JC25_9AGAR